MSNVAFAVAAVVACLVALSLWTSLRKARRVAFIRNYRLPKGLLDKVARRHPHLARRDLELVDRGLRQFFLAHLQSGLKFVSMPSQVADDLWHEFILYTKAYQEFCDRAFGRFLHHTPAVVLAPGQRDSNAGLRRVWYWACKDELIDPKNPSRLPLLFALDAKLNIKGGYHYVADCKGVRKTDGTTPYCGGDFSSSSVDGGTTGFGDGDSAGSGAGDGGDGGGGCGGGGD